MTQAPSRDLIEEIAEAIGATRPSILKWRQRGIPGDWALRIVADSDGRLTAADMIIYEQARAELDRAPEPAAEVA